MRRLLTIVTFAALAISVPGIGMAADADSATSQATVKSKAEEARLAKEAVKQAKKDAAEAKKEAAQAKKDAEQARKDGQKGKKIAAKDDPNAIGNRNVSKGLNIYSIEKEIALGKGMAQDIERQAKIIDDPIIAEYINRVGQNIVRNSDAEVPFTIKVVEDESVNAFALPGGFFFVNTGLILKADTEAELAGVMAHEIAHVAARHGTKQASAGEMMQLATIPLIFLGGGWANYGIRQAVQLAIPVGFLQFSRRYESEADNLGLQYMYKTGYDPVAFVDFFEKIQAMEKKKAGSISKYFSTHPMTESRIENAQKSIQNNLEARPEYVVTTSEFNKVKARLAMLENRHKVDSKDVGGPTLRKKPSSAGDDDAKGDDSKDDRPTLQRKQ
ncbi:MAG: M48 family metallopeptidase [Acidobacteriota bacterium]